MDRRGFLAKSVQTAGAMLAVAAAPLGPRHPGGRKMETRKLGRTGRELSVIGLGGIVVMNAEPEAAQRVVAESVERGVTYFDVAPSYGDAELKLGPALKPFRDRVFLACKTARRDRAGAEEELAASLQRLQTDHVDLYQLHALTDVEADVQAALGKGGAMEAIQQARKDGRVRHIGFSAHSPEAALAAMREFEFDTVLYPINFVCHVHSRFEEPVIAEAKKRGMGILALKAMARHKRPPGAERTDYKKCWYQPIDEAELARLALGWTLARGVTAALPPGEEALYRMALDLAPRLAPPTDAELEQLRTVAKPLEPIFES